MGLSAAEMDEHQDMRVSGLGMQSASVLWTPKAGKGSMSTTLVSGSAFITMEYQGLQPVLFSSTGGFHSSVQLPWNTSVPQAGGVKKVYKFKVTTDAVDDWLVYVFDLDGKTPFKLDKFKHLDNRLAGPANFNGYIQIARLPGAPRKAKSKHGKRYNTADKKRQLDAELVYDMHAGTYATTLELDGSVDINGESGTYSFAFKPTKLVGNPLLTFLLRHHQDAIHPETGIVTTLSMWSPSKGLMKAYSGHMFAFGEKDLPTEYKGFLGPLTFDRLSRNALDVISYAAEDDLTQDIDALTNLESFYFSGKALAKFAQICLVTNDVLKNATSVKSCVARVEAALEVFIKGNNANPRAWDSDWMGIISSCGVNKTPDVAQSCDFGNVVYNDHHFHHGYFIYTAAILARLHPQWLTKGNNKAFINLLARDYANPSRSDKFFPLFRNFNWFDGHSVAHGILSVNYGKDEESSSEDYNSIYALKLWGEVIGDQSMVGRSNLMLGVMRRSMQDYILMSQDNTVQPPNFIHNFVAGILFESKVNHTTWFGNNPEFIHGIHMLPLTPLSAYFRTRSFVEDEWKTVLAGLVKTVVSGWNGVIMANLGLINPVESFKYFANAALDKGLIDDGASRTWYLTLAAGRGGSEGYTKRPGHTHIETSVSGLTTSAKPTSTAKPSKVKTGKHRSKTSHKPKA
jgi:endo-1,3(4)-beta-glucanase